MLGGVAHGLAVHLGLPLAWVRIAFVLLFFANGIGGLLYAAFWFVVPIGIGEPARGSGLGVTYVWVNGAFVPAGASGVSPEPLLKGRRGRLGRLRDLLQRTFQGEPAPAPATDGTAPSSGAASRQNLGQLAALLMLVIGVMALLNALNIQSSQPYAWPLLAIGVGVALVWRQADDSRWQRWFGLDPGSRRSSAFVRVGAGVLLVTVGIIGFLVLQGAGPRWPRWWRPRSRCWPGCWC